MGPLSVSLARKMSQKRVRFNHSQTMTEHDLTTIPRDRHLLIAGPTASGKSALAMQVARAQGGLIVNADALQVWSCWRLLTARPSAEDEAALPLSLIHI